ncbi:hypothetical protein [Nocardia sp. NPDC049526]|uniref:hypothetical protein n=1 Tax=Nocardia sp. NPDC049526 TaxID=3364316 RepID=UPI0037A19353
MGAKGNNSYNELMIRYGYADAAARIQEHFLAGHKEQAAAAVPDQLARELSLIGSEAALRRR